MKQTQICYPTPVNLSPPSTTSFKTTAAALEDAAPRTHTLRDGEVVLYKRTRSRVWQCKYKLFTGQWVRISTRKSVLEHAVRVATEMYDEARYRERLGLAPVQKSFADIARVTVEELRRDLAAGTGKKIFVDYISIAHSIDGGQCFHVHRGQHSKRWRTLCAGVLSDGANRSPTVRDGRGMGQSGCLG